MIFFKPFKNIIGGFVGKDDSYLGEYGLSLKDLVLLKQVHGDTLYEIKTTDDAQRVRNKEGDALISTLPGQAIAIKTADCVPILLAHPEGVASAVHAGWRGTEARILKKVLEKLQKDYGLQLGDVRVAIGPAISGESYEVGEEVAEKFSEFGETVLKKIYQEKYLLNLPEANRQIALAAGLDGSKIEMHELCTLNHEEHYHSHRAALARGEEKAGRNYAWVKILDGPGITARR